MTESKTKNPPKDFFALSVIGMLGLGALTFCISLFNTVALLAVSKKAPPTLVQLLDGKAVTVTAISSSQRTPETIKRFVNETFALMFNWSGKLPANNEKGTQAPQEDPGVKVSSEGAGLNSKVTTSSWQASFALSSDFRSTFLQKIAQLTPNEVFSGDSQVVLVMRNVGAPQQVSVGKWKVSVVADLIYFDHSNNAGSALPLNKEVFVQAIDPPLTPLEDAASPLEKAIYEVRQAGLEIYAIRELNRENL